MTKGPRPDGIDWNLTTWEGSRRNQVERWSRMSLDEILEAQEAMAALATELAGRRAEPPPDTADPLATGVSEPPAPYAASSDPRHDLRLDGCTPEPLMAYLKALAVLRLVSEQKDPGARGWWNDDMFWLRSSLDRDALIDFFLEEYRPTPIVVPWSGGDFFGVNWQPDRTTHSKTPTSSKAIEAILCTTTPRFRSYRRALRACKVALEQCGIDSQDQMKKHKKQKWLFLQTLRSSCDQPRVIEWIDAAAIIGAEKFAALLGSGGGSDGNAHFSDNFMQNLWDILPDFDDQRRARRGQACPSVREASRGRLENALFAVRGGDLVPKRTSSLYDSGAVGGPNATQGLVRESLSNPWDVTLALEGCTSFAGAAAKRLAAHWSTEAAFPFQVSASVTIAERLADGEQAAKELWMPLWSRPARSDEILLLLREGRAECGPRPARSGVDMARAVTSLGVDRGVRAFRRYAIVKGRVGGDNYNTAASLGRFEVVERRAVDLLREIDSWREALQRATRDKTVPPRFISALRRIDSAIVEFCKYGGAPLFQEVIVSLGAAERALAISERFRDAKRLQPLAGLSPAWIEAANDCSPEFAVALALASVHDREAKIGPLRANLEPVVVGRRKTGGSYANWAEKERAVVWTTTDLPTNLAHTLARRMMDGERSGCERLPLASRFGVPLSTVAEFLAGETDDERITELIWGLMLIRGESIASSDPVGTADASVPRAYALLKLLFLPRPLVFERRTDGTLRPRLLRDNERGGVAVRPEPAVLHLLRSGRLGEACAIAMRRLRASGLAPMPTPIRGRGVRDDVWRELNHMGGAGIDSRRLAAALLIPIRHDAVSRLVHLIIHGDRLRNEETASVVEMNAEGGTPR